MPNNAGRKSNLRKKIEGLKELYIDGKITKNMDDAPQEFVIDVIQAVYNEGADRRFKGLFNDIYDYNNIDNIPLDEFIAYDINKDENNREVNISRYIKDNGDIKKEENLIDVNIDNDTVELLKKGNKKDKVLAISSLTYDAISKAQELYERKTNVEYVYTSTDKTLSDTYNSVSEEVRLSNSLAVSIDGNENIDNAKKRNCDRIALKLGTIELLRAFRGDDEIRKYIMEKAVENIGEIDRQEAYEINYNGNDYIISDEELAVANSPELVDKYKVLKYGYNEDGKRKNITEIFDYSIEEKERVSEYENSKEYIEQIDEITAQRVYECLMLSTDPKRDIARFVSDYEKLGKDPYVILKNLNNTYDKLQKKDEREDAKRSAMVEKYIYELKDIDIDDYEDFFVFLDEGDYGKTYPEITLNIQDGINTTKKDLDNIDIDKIISQIDKKDEKIEKYSDKLLDEKDKAIEKLEDILNEKNREIDRISKEKEDEINRIIDEKNREIENININDKEKLDNINREYNEREKNIKEEYENKLEEITGNNKYLKEKLEEKEVENNNLNKEIEDKDREYNEENSKKEERINNLEEENKNREETINNLKDEYNELKTEKEYQEKELNDKINKLNKAKENGDNIEITKLKEDIDKISKTLDEVKEELKENKENIRIDINIENRDKVIEKEYNLFINQILEENNLGAEQINNIKHIGIINITNKIEELKRSGYDDERLNSKLQNEETRKALYKEAFESSNNVIILLEKLDNVSLIEADYELIDEGVLDAEVITLPPPKEEIVENVEDIENINNIEKNEEFKTINELEQVNIEEYQKEVEKEEVKEEYKPISELEQVSIDDYIKELEEKREEAERKRELLEKEKLKEEKSYKLLEEVDGQLKLELGNKEQGRE